MSKTIELTDKDSGTNGFTVHYQNYDAVGTARFIGGATITGWTQHSGSIYKADVGKGWSFQTLYENGKRARKARTTNLAFDAKYPMAQAAYLKAVSVQSSSTIFEYNAGELDPTDWNSDAQVFIWSGGAGTTEWDWFTDTVPIVSVDKASRRITLAQPTRYAIVNGSRYFVQGALSLLDQAGEFYLDTAAGTLYYWPMDGAIAEQTIIAPKLQRLISLVGSSETSRVHNVRFEGLSFESTDFTNWYRWGWVSAGDSKEGHQYPDFDRQIELPANRTGMLFMQNTDNIQFRFCHFKDSGYSGAYLFGCNQYDTFYGNLIEHTGYAGLFFTGNYPGEGDVNRNNVVSNNKIHDVGELVGHPSGVYFLNAGNSEISYGEIYNSPRYGIAFLGIKDAPSAAIYTRNNVFKYLKIHDCSQDSGDTAPLYAFGLSKTSPYVSNSVEQVTIDRVYPHPAMRDYAPVGIYMDNQTYGQSFKNVKLTNVGSGTLFNNNESGNHTNVNVNWTGTFDDTKIEYSSIGVKADFPAEYK